MCFMLQKHAASHLLCLHFSQLGVQRAVSCSTSAQRTPRRLIHFLQLLTPPPLLLTTSPVWAASHSTRARRRISCSREIRSQAAAARGNVPWKLRACTEELEPVFTSLPLLSSLLPAPAAVSSRCLVAAVRLEHPRRAAAAAAGASVPVRCNTERSFQCVLLQITDFIKPPEGKKHERDSHLGPVLGSFWLTVGSSSCFFRALLL